jgi:predicted enzyme related to lactoylglutathione lyase
VRVSRIYYLVLMVRDMEATCGFYSRVLKVTVEEFEGGRLT